MAKSELKGENAAALMRAAQPRQGEGQVVPQAQEPTKRRTTRQSLEFLWAAAGVEACGGGDEKPDEGERSQFQNLVDGAGGMP